MRKLARRKASHRFVMYISGQLREQIEDLVRQNGLTLAAFGRRAFESYLSQLQMEERNRQLTKTCMIFEQKNQQVFNQWADVEKGWPVKD
ncbi:hypothetical protein MJD09_00310 [bacterium]|nr:hypothetical protein [bacterium]